MKLTIDKNQIGMNPEQFLRRAGYGYIRDRRSGSESFVRRLGSGLYPRLHMYVEERGGQIVFNLHLDQKQPSYAGVRMHNAEHGGEVVESEVERLKQLIGQPACNVESGSEGGDALDKIGHGEYDKNIEAKPVKSSWWRRLFGH